ncbi:hypothetical protein ACFQMA_13930 [Halosimplex aquaticum]|uniref:Uncharacterized protein n=1 Tax=Halosimplex aquaticum TaxID=3026162 RepID=A0ABD5Y926_9EURY|nr:hypothetical protein [Halosimplex aquaticum]
MSTDETGQHRDAQDDDQQTAGDPLTWDEAASGFQRRREERRTIGVEIPDVGVATFTLRGLTREERDDVEQAAASVTQRGRGDPDVEVDTGAIRRKTLEYGIVDGPDGFKPGRADHLNTLPPGVQDELVDVVESLSTLSVEEHDGFQEMG